MKPEQFLRLVEEICFMLKFNQPSTHQVIEFYKRFKDSDTHDFRSEIIIGACVFLVSKIQENENKIRDIVNVCYVVTSLYKLANKRKEVQGIEYINFKFMMEELKNEKMIEQIVPNFSLDQYNNFKKDILQAEQHLLRVLNYDLETSKMTNYKLLINYIHHFKLPRVLMDLIIKIYNDSIFAEVEESPKCCMHFCIQLALKAQIIQETQIDKRLCDKDWWKQYMQVEYQDLLKYGVQMMRYYDNIE